MSDEVSFSPDGAPEKLRMNCPNCKQKLDASGLAPFSITECPLCGAEIIIPQKFGDYLLEEMVGQGGMAVVYRAEELTLKREVAIKILNEDITGQGDTAELFLHEARTAATVVHRSVIPVYTCGTIDGATFISMQFMHGGSLEDKIEDGEVLSIPRVLQWVCDVAEGLRNAARAGIVHHDIKPGNIMLDNDDNAHVGDFGIANSILPGAEDTEQLLKTINNFITPNYVSPEKVQGKGEDCRGDIYSLGATFFHLLVGHPPFQNSDVYEVARMRLRIAPPIAGDEREDIPPAISQLIFRMMAYKPEDRPSYDEIISTLNKQLVLVQGASMHVPTKAMAALKANYAFRAVLTFIIMVVAGALAYFITRNVTAAEFPHEALAQTRVSISVLADSSCMTALVPAQTLCPLPVTRDHLSARAAKLPRRPDFTAQYSGADDAFCEGCAQYQAPLDTPLRMREEILVRELQAFQPELCALMVKYPYAVAPIQLKDELQPYAFTGTILAYPTHLAIPQAENNVRLHVPWSRLAPEQMEKFTRYYAELLRSGGLNDQSARLYFRLAVFQDWMGHFDRAAASLNKAVELDPSAGECIAQLFAL